MKYGIGFLLMTIMTGIAAGMTESRPLRVLLILIGIALFWVALAFWRVLYPWGL